MSSLLLFLRLDPGINLPPALVRVKLAAGLLEKDGLLLMTGFGLFVANGCLDF
jgi:hypothetical protein